MPIRDYSNQKIENQKGKNNKLNNVQIMAKEFGKGDKNGKESM